MAERDPLLVLGLGNLLCQDDGVGVAAVARLLARYDAAPGVRVLDGGTLGLSLLPTLESADTVLIVDAIRAEGPPGTLVRLEGEAVAHAAEHRLSVHQVGVSDLIGAARWQGCLPGRLLLLGVVPESMELGVERSAAVEAALPGLVELVAKECALLGYPFALRQFDETTKTIGHWGDVYSRLFGLQPEVR
ncbi:MAG: HyaD/HybD family hydrogenase maturation endopeptidase [Myxococcaceae bacterium]